MQFKICTVDAFTNKSFHGNSAAVCLQESDISDETRQLVAREMNLSETAFLKTISKTESVESANSFELRWFTPTNEVDLCGHATLASAAALKYWGNNSEIFCFETKSGKLYARMLPSGQITLDMPKNAPAKIDPTLVQSLIKSVIGEMKFSEVFYSDRTKKLLIRLDDSVVSKSDLENIKPSLPEMVAVSESLKVIVKGVIVTLKGLESNGCMDENGKLYDFVSRYFAPWVGIPEDPVTGSAHIVSGPYWSEVLQKNQLYARQCSARGGDLSVFVRNDDRVDISGSSVVSMSGTLFL